MTTKPAGSGATRKKSVGDRKSAAGVPFSMHFDRNSRKGTQVKKLLLSTVALVIAGLGVGAGAASANPSVTVCHDVSITINGENVSDAACNTAP